MGGIQAHLRNTFLAGIFAVVPVAFTIFIVIKVDQLTRQISQYLFGKPIPVVGTVIAIAGIYVAGLLVSASAGKFVLRTVDAVILRLPGLKQLYVAWKQIALTPGGGSDGVFSRVVLIPDETGATHLLGFTNGRPIADDSDTLCVFVPASPNPINGRLYFVHRDKCTLVELSTEEAFKVILSTGNYVPPEIAGAMRRLILPGATKPTAASIPVNS